ncbi:Abcb10 [Symbiodinium sp. CCMP2456]|nr:Abcb10 [Symbiodinium sp. CCMP2456]
MKEVWIWDPVDANAAFQHPQEPPENNLVMAKECFMDGKIGARLNKLSRATLVDQNGSIAMVTREDGSRHEVPRARLLQWYEGLLVLQELEAKSDAGVTWFDDRCRDLLIQARKKYKSGILGSLYVERKLLNISVTGKRLDAEGPNFTHRRPEVKDVELPAEGEDEAVPGRFSIVDITGYMPPWEAWCHEHAGFYQDFYQVQWKSDKGTAWAGMNFSKVENGAVEAGSTWEPDDCIPPSLDGMRLREKTRWFKRKRVQEQKAEKELAEATKSKRPRNESSSRLPEPPANLGRYRRNGSALMKDLFLQIGHDFDRAEAEASKDVCSGWPRKAEDYPPGYGCADPPGICHATCDCMDENKLPEQTKAWLEDPRRSSDAAMAIHNLSLQKHFVARRGSVSNWHRFEPVQTGHADQTTHAKAALDLSKVLEESVRSVLKDLPILALQQSGDSVRIPAGALLKPSEDYVPVHFQLSQTAAARQWLSLSEDGKLSLMGNGPPSRPAPFRVEFLHSEGLTAVVDCMVTDTQQKPWLSASATIAARFTNVALCPLSRNVRVVLQEHLRKMFSFETKVAKEVSLGRWLDVADMLIRMLRTTATVDIVKPDAQTSRPPPRAAAVARAG